MKNSISFILDIVPPTATAQGSSFVLKNRKTGKPFIGKPGNSPYAKAKKKLMEEFDKHTPKKPLCGPIYCNLIVVWPWRKAEPKKNRHGLMFKYTKPDEDNYKKLIYDCLAKCGFFVDGDQQIANTSFSKFWGGKPGMHITLAEEESHELPF